MESILHTNGKIESKAIPETNTDVILNPDNPDYARAVRFNNANDYLQRELRVIQEAIEMLNQFPDIPDDVNGIPAPEEYGLADRLSVLIDNIAPSTQSRLATTRSGWEFPESVIDTQLFKTHLSRPSYSNSSISGFHRSCKRFSFNGPFPTTDNDDSILDINI